MNQNINQSLQKKDEGRDQEIKNGEIFYRYSGRTQTIMFAELNQIIESRLDTANKQWISLMSKIARSGPSNVAILDTEKGVIEKNDDQLLLIDEELIKKIKFIKEGHFEEKRGSVALKLVGDVQSVNSFEVTKTIQKRLTDQYPLSWSEVVEGVKKQVSGAKLSLINQIIRDNDLKNNTQYSDYNFRTKIQEEVYKKSGKLPGSVASIYNENVVRFIVNVIKK